MDILVWTIRRGGLRARVGEDGEVDGDPELVEELRRRLGEPVTVHRHGTVRTHHGAPEVRIELHPGDRRYVVARIRALCEQEPEFEIDGTDWR